MKRKLSWSDKTFRDTIVNRCHSINWRLLEIKHTPSLRIEMASDDWQNDGWPVILLKWIMITKLMKSLNPLFLNYLKPAHKYIRHLLIDYLTDLSENIIISQKCSCIITMLIWIFTFLNDKNCIKLLKKRK